MLWWCLFWLAWNTVMLTVDAFYLPWLLLLQLPTMFVLVWSLRLWAKEKDKEYAEWQRRWPHG